MGRVSEVSSRPIELLQPVSETESVWRVGESIFKRVEREEGGRMSEWRVNEEMGGAVSLFEELCTREMMGSIERLAPWPV